MFAPGEGGQPAAIMAAMALGADFSRVYDNPYSTPGIRSVQLDFDVEHERHWARLESARTDVTEARPGGDITIEALLRPYRGDPVVHQIPVHIPTSISRGTLRILVSDGETLDRLRQSSPFFESKLDLASTIALLNKEHVNNRVYVSPFSIMNVMDGMRGTQEMVVQAESSVNESQTPPLDYVVSGAQVLTITIR
jgi:hypothetical protein